MAHKIKDGWWLLRSGGYPDTEGDYEFFGTKASPPDWLPAECVAHVFDGARSPWEEHDPYPDWVAFRGRSGHGWRQIWNWERA